jgi:hypothetical protein
VARIFGRGILFAAAASLVMLVQATGAGAGGRATALAKVNVTFTDSTLRVTPTTPGSGQTTFVVVNKGKKKHALFVQGPGLKNAHTAPLAAGGHASLTVKLKAGAYTLSDPAGLGEYRVFFLDVVQNATLTAKGDASVSGSPDSGSSAMCGYQLTTP